jgi:hypothetical protein
MLRDALKLLALERAPKANGAVRA